MHRIGWGWLFALLAGGALGVAWIGEDAGPVRGEPPQAAGPGAPPAALRDRAPAATPIGPDEAEAAITAEPTPALPAVVAPDAPGPPDPADEAELERVGEALAREPALIDAMQDAATDPDPVVRAEAEALVVEALERARARPAAPARAAP